MERELCCITSNDGETPFFISIFELGWIYDVFLIITNQLKSSYEESELIRVNVDYSGKEIIDGRTFSVFTTSYRFDEPSDFMVAFFTYSINGVNYVTLPMCFAVEDEKGLNKKIKEK